MNYLYLCLSSFAVAIIFSAIVCPLILFWQKRIIKNFVCSLKDEYLVDSSISEDKNNFLFLFPISFLITFAFLDGIRQIGIYAYEYSVFLSLFFVLALLLVAYFYFQMVIITDKRIFLKVLFPSLFLKNKEIIIDEIDSIIINKEPQSTVIMKDVSYHRIWLPKANQKVLELLQDKLL